MSFIILSLVWNEQRVHEISTRESYLYYFTVWRFGFWIFEILYDILWPLIFLLKNSTCKLSSGKSIATYANVKVGVNLYFLKSFKDVLSTRNTKSVIMKKILDQRYLGVTLTHLLGWLCPINNLVLSNHFGTKLFLIVVKHI